MGTVIGIDVGGSTTKIVGFDKNRRLIDPICVKANDPVASTYGAFGKFTDCNSIDLNEIDRIMMTGVGSSYLLKPIYGLDCEKVAEFDCIGHGGLYVSGLSSAVVVSMGTGTAIVDAKEGKKPVYLGGTGIGGGTLTGLSKKLIGVRNIDDIIELAGNGNLANVDLRVCDMTPSIEGMNNDLTASNFGRVSDLATKEDLALGLVNMVFETALMMSVFAARHKNQHNIIMTGNLTKIPQAKKIFDTLGPVFEKNIIIPENSSFATAIGCALSGLQ